MPVLEIKKASPAGWSGMLAVSGAYAKNRAVGSSRISGSATQ